MAGTLSSPDSAGAMQIGTPNILSMAPLTGTLKMIIEAGLDNIRAKSLMQTETLIQLADASLSEFNVRVVSPRDGDRRGGHVALAHTDAQQICRALRSHGVVPDFRPPDIIRLCPSSLYTRFEECVTAMDRLHHIMETGEYREFPANRPLIP